MNCDILKKREGESINMKKWIAAVISAALALNTAILSVSADETADTTIEEWLAWYSSMSSEDKLAVSFAPTYTLPDGTPVTGLKSVGGIKYQFDENGVFIGEYTGWTRNVKTGERNYYINGRRQVGWRTVNGKKYYFYYESGYAAGDVQIEDKIYTFDEKGVFTGKTAEPAVYTKNISEVYYADDMPERIRVNTYYKVKDYPLFKFDVNDDGQRFCRIERYNSKNADWDTVEMNIRYLEEQSGVDFGFGLVGEGAPISEDPDELIEDPSYIELFLYHDRFTPGKYRAVFSVTATAEGKEQGFEDREFYSYFTIK